MASSKTAGLAENLAPDTDLVIPAQEPDGSEDYKIVLSDMPLSDAAVTADTAVLNSAADDATTKADAAEAAAAVDATTKADAAQAAAVQRANHTGTQAQSTITDLTTDLAAKIPLTQKGAVSGVASLDASGKVPVGQLPASAFSSVDVVASEAAMLALSGAVEGALAIRTDTETAYVLSTNSPETLGDWILFPIAGGAAVDSVDGLTGVVDLSGNYDALGAAAAAQAAAVQRANHTGTQSADTIIDGSTNHVFTAADDTKLAGIATGATANSSNATLLARANHTGTQSADTITDGSTNVAMTTSERTQLASLVAGSLGTPGVVHLMDFAGANDDARFGNALTSLAAETYRRALMMPSYADHGTVTLSTTRTPFSGMKIIAPFANDGAKNLAGGLDVDNNHKILFTGGNGTSSLFYSTGNVYDVFIDGLCFSLGSGNEQFWHQPSGTCYSSEFRSLAFYGFQHIFGNTANKALMTRCNFTGNWSVHAMQDIAFHMGGSDCWHWHGGNINIEAAGTSPAGAGRALIWYDGMQKSHIANIYLTTKGDWGGLRLTGSSSQPSIGTFVTDCVFEGREDGSPTFAQRPVVTVDGTGGVYHLRNIGVGNVDDGANALGCIEQTASTHLDIDGLDYWRVTSVTAVTFPLVYQSSSISGTLTMRNIYCRPGEQARVRLANGTTSTLAAPANSIPT